MSAGILPESEPVVAQDWLLAWRQENDSIKRSIINAADDRFGSARYALPRNGSHLAALPRHPARDRPLEEGDGSVRGPNVLVGAMVFTH